MSTYPINIQIPAAGHNPSIDQQPMQTNFANISGFLSVDHSAPGTTNTAGKHNQVRFALNQTAPALDTAVAELYANNSQIYFNNGTVNTPLTANIVPSAAASGQTFLPGGLILKWGNYPSAGDGTLIPFTPNFPTAAFSVVITINSGTPALNPIWVRENSLGVGGFRTDKPSGATSNFPIYWFAIGN